MSSPTHPNINYLNTTKLITLKTTGLGTSSKPKISTGISRI